MDRERLLPSTKPIGQLRKGGRPPGSVSLNLEDPIKVCVASSEMNASLKQGELC